MTRGGSGLNNDRGTLRNGDNSIILLFLLLFPGARSTDCSEASALDLLLKSVERGLCLFYTPETEQGTL